VYGVGDDPDPRFSLANERTLLAWLRTALALVVAGVAVVALAELLRPAWLVDAIAGIAFAGGAGTAVLGYRQWWRTERAMRQREPLPSSGVTLLVLLVVLGLAVVGASAMVQVGR
jgi:putative membrane protein